MGVPQCLQPSTPWTVQLFHLSFHRGLYRLFSCVPHRLSSCYIKHGVGCLTGFPTMFLEDVPLLLQDILSQMGFLRSGRLNGFLRWLVKSLSSAAVSSSSDSPGDDSRCSSKHSHKSGTWFPSCNPSFSSVLRRELEWDKLCVVVLGINEYEKLNYWILQCKLYFEHKFFISEC